ncbi:MAG: hypothetical protein IKZ87_07490 [Actinomycetaceae bacterium]|nr:hypothetical protein [Actinomycetaceae bacterium]
MIHRQPALFVLSDGRTFRGRVYGASGQTLGKAVFTSAVTGYQQIFTNPETAGQIIVMAAPHIGNTGVNPEFAASDSYHLAGVVVRDPARRASHWQSTGELEPELAGAGVVGICDIDTRAIVRHLRDNGEDGAMGAGIFSGDALPRGAYEGDEAALENLVEIVRGAGKEN